MVYHGVKITVIGTGRMGYYHVRLLSRMGFLDSIIDSNFKRAQNIGEQFDVPYYATIDEMLKEHSPNGGIIAVPTPYHPSVSLEALEKISSLKALLIEKPIASSIEEAIDFKVKLAKYNLKIIIGHSEAFNPIVTRINEILKDKIIGETRSLLFQRRGAVGESRVELLGDVYEDIGIHDFDIFLRLLSPNHIRIFSTAVKTNSVDNSSSIIIAPENGRYYVTLLMSREYAGKLRIIDIEGTKGTLRANLITQILELRSLEIASGEKDTSAIRIPFSSGEQVKVYGEPLLQEMWNLVDCISGKNIPLVSIDDGINALKLVEAARRSISSGKIIHLQFQT